MAKVAPVQRRKAEHLHINLKQDVSSSLQTGLEKLHFTHQALPELDLKAVNPGLDLFGRHLKAPLLISSMLGGTPEATRINRRLAKAAATAGIAIGIGSQRAAIDRPALAGSFRIRRYAPEALIFANLGAVQLNYGYGLDECRRALDMINADALILHLNPLQEALQVGGNTDFVNLAPRIENICRHIGVPVVVKEVGWGMSDRTARMLAECGVSAIDVAGAGGTSWSQVEMHRAPSDFMRQLAAPFVDWGIPTAESIVLVKSAIPGMCIFASGGLRDGIDVAKCIALGATLGGMAGPLLRAAAVSSERAAEAIRLIVQQLRIAMFAAGAGDIESLRRTPLKER
jgi:isopentenyl-diphosphate delta-isomerase